jgi:hypothetical protein
MIKNTFDLMKFDLMIISRAAGLNLLGLGFSQIKIYLLCIRLSHSFTPFAYPAIKHPSLVQPYIFLQMQHI